MQQNIPVTLRNDAGEVVKIADGKYDDRRGTFRFRVDLDTLKDEHRLFGKAIELGLVETLHLRAIASDLGIEAVVAQGVHPTIEGFETGENNPNRIAVKAVE